MSYEDQLLAAGLAPEDAAAYAWANEVVRFRNREHPAYGAPATDDEESP
jgi:hypothetical protein